MNPQIERLKTDLETIKTAAGLGGPPISHTDIWAWKWCGYLGLLWTALGLLSTVISDSILLVANGILGAGYVALYLFKYRNSDTRTVRTDKALRFSYVLTAVFMVACGGFYVWGIYLGELSGQGFTGAMMILVGCMMLVWAISDKWRYSYFPCAIGFVGAGCAAPFLEPRSLLTGIGLVTAFSGFAAALILSHQLRALKENEKPTH